VFAATLGDGKKEHVSLVLYTAAIPLASAASWIALAIYITVTLMWLVPDRCNKSRLEG